MAKTTELTETTTPAQSDILPLVITPGGTPANRKVTVASLFTHAQTVASASGDLTVRAETGNVLVECPGGTLQVNGGNGVVNADTLTVDGTDLAVSTTTAGVLHVSAADALDLTSVNNTIRLGATSTGGGGVRITPVTYATRPGDPLAGALANLSDAVVSGGANAITGGSGSEHVLARFDGSIWRALGAAPRQTYLTWSTTGTANNWAPGLAGHTFIDCTLSADLTITGIAGGVTGQLVTIRNSSSSALVHLAHNSGSSSTGNKLSNRATSAATRLAPGGSATYFYTGTVWLLVEHEQGAWITMAFSAGDYVSLNSSGVPTGSFTVSSSANQLFKYRLAGTTLSLKLLFIGTAATTNGIKVSNITGGYSMTDVSSAVEYVPMLHEGGAFTVLTGFAQASAATVLTFWKSALAAFTNGQVNAYLAATVDVS